MKLILFSKAGGQHGQSLKTQSIIQEKLQEA